MSFSKSKSVFKFFSQHSFSKMGIVKTLVRPKSKYDSSIPYTYEARIDPLDGIGDESDLEYFYSDTLCGLIHFLDEQHISPKDVTLIALYNGDEIEIDPGPMMQEEKWLKRPRLCRSLEKHYENSKLIQYKGHEKHSDCSYTDRDQSII